MNISVVFFVYAICFACSVKANRRIQTGQKEQMHRDRFSDATRPAILSSSEAAEENSVTPAPEEQPKCELANAMANINIGKLCPDLNPYDKYPNLDDMGITLDGITEEEKEIYQSYVYDLENTHGFGSLGKDMDVEADCPIQINDGEDCPETFERTSEWNLPEGCTIDENKQWPYFYPRNDEDLYYGFRRDFLGPPIEVRKGPRGLGQCQKLCNLHRQCEGYSFWARDGRCHLHLTDPPWGLSPQVHYEQKVFARNDHGQLLYSGERTSPFKQNLLKTAMYGKVYSGEKCMSKAEAKKYKDKLRKENRAVRRVLVAYFVGRNKAGLSPY